MGEGRLQNQKMGRDALCLGENVSPLQHLVGRLLDSEPLSLEALRILRVVEPEENEKRIGTSTGQRVEASRNFWEGSGLKIDSSSTDVIWGHGGKSLDKARARSLFNPVTAYSNKIFTSAKNGEIITWDINKSSNVKYGIVHQALLRLRTFSFALIERRARDHTRAIHRLSYSNILHYYCLTGSADCDVRIWVIHPYDNLCGDSDGM